MSDLDDFLAETHPRLVAEVEALHNGDSVGDSGCLCGEGEFQS